MMVMQVFRIPTRFLALILTVLGYSQNGLAVPGDILFEDEFERAALGPDWTVSDTNLAGINAYPVNTGNSAFTRGDEVTVESLVFNLSIIGGANLSMTLEKGADAEDPLSEDPDEFDEDFVLEYLASDLVTWVVLATLDAEDLAEEEQIEIDEDLPSGALHSAFQFRFRQTGGSGGPPANNGVGWDFWHIDDVVLTETSGIFGPPPVLSTNSCEQFENGLGNWTASGPGNFGTSTVTHSPTSPTRSLFLNEAMVSLTSVPFDATSVNEITAWIRKGDDSFSENPDNNEDLLVEFSNDGVIFTEIETFESNGPGSLANGEIVTPTWNVPGDFTVSPTFQIRFTLTAATGVNFDFWHVDELCFAGGMALPTVLKTVQIISDPVNGTTNPKAIPGAILEYSITVTNSGDGSSDEDTIKISDTLDPNATFFAGDFGSGAPANSPFLFTNGTGADLSGLAYDFFSLGNGFDSPTFFTDGGGGTPVEIFPAAGFDPAVRSFDIELRGQFRPENIGTPEFTITYRVRLE